MRNTIGKRITSLAAPSRRAQTLAGLALSLLLVAAALAGQALWLHSRTAGIGKAESQTRAASSGSYLYYILKSPEGFVLARAHKGANNQPGETPKKVASFGGNFGQTTADTILSLQLSPDGRYLAIDGSRSDSEQIWIFDTLRLVLTQEPASASGTFLRWLPGSRDAFLFRPMFPLGPGAANVAWNPGLWQVDAATGKYLNLVLPVPSSSLVDAIASPDGSRIIYSTTDGVGAGSSVWSMDGNGQNQKLLLQLPGDAQSIAGMFTWSPDGRTLAYERLADSPTPFLPAGIWTMDSQGQHQRYLAQGDGGHGFALNWSPDGRSIAFVTRTNLAENLANVRPQALKSAIEIIDVNSGQVRTLAGSIQTGVQINVDPVWNASGTQLTFVAFNPLNPEFGGSPRYWSVEARPAAITPAVAPLTRPLVHVVAFE
jgi:Tol biopolymer transport system component